MSFENLAVSAAVVKSFLASCADDIETIVSLVNVPRDSFSESTGPSEFAKTERNLVRRPLEKFIEDAFLFPASQSNHDSEPGGLVRHTFLVIRNALEAARLNPTFTFERRVTLFAICLIHDANKIWMYRVESVTPPGRVWDQGDMRLAKWASSNAGSGAEPEISAVRLSRTQNAQGGSYAYLETTTITTIHRYFYKTLRNYIGLENLAAIVLALAQDKQPPSFDFTSIFRAADRDATKIGRGRIDEITLRDHVREAIQASLLRVNDWNDQSAYHLLSATHFLVKFPLKYSGTKDQTCVFRQALAIIKDFGVGDHEQPQQVLLKCMRDDFIRFSETGDMAKDLTVTCFAGERPFTAVAIAIEGFVPAKLIPIAKPFSDAITLESKDVERRKNPLKTVENLGFTRMGPDDACIREHVRLTTKLFKMSCPQRRTSSERAIWADIDKHGAIRLVHCDLAMVAIIERKSREMEAAGELVKES